ncbi:MAG TPA: type II toxin-antitoxin system VapC family toxin [Thermoanaerobaculia bacterium]|jgi:predicted nucleic acid-binding protein|nr:type II toxin-antitoxin system VapC family toxin [Thermoanaerobaculia bacterium]
MLIVVDASVIVDALSGVATVAAELRKHELHAPVTIDAEFLHAMRRRWIVKLLDEDAAPTVMKAFREMAIARHPITPLVDRIWSLRRNITAYDAGYVALAESLNLPLLTRDWRLAHSSGHTAGIEYIA